MSNDDIILAMITNDGQQVRGYILAMHTIVVVVQCCSMSPSSPQVQMPIPFRCGIGHLDCFALRVSGACRSYVPGCRPEGPVICCPLRRWNWQCPCLPGLSLELRIE